MQYLILLGIIDIENCKEEMISDEKINIKRIETKILNGRKINVKVLLEVETKIYSSNCIDIVSHINNLDDIQTLTNNKTINCLVGFGNTKAYAKDTINLDNTDDVSEIMKVAIKIINRDIKLSYNKVLTKADAEVVILYLTEDNKIKNVVTQVPVMGFVDIENVGDDNICDVNYNIGNLIIKPNSGDNHSIYMEAEINISCFAYETKGIDIIEDLYSISSNLSFTQKEIVVMSDKQNIKDTCLIKEEVVIPEIGNNKLYNVETIPKILNINIRNGKIIYEGELNLEFLYEVNNSIDSANTQIPFTFEINSDYINERCKIYTNIDVKKDDFVLNGGNIEANIELEFNVNTSKGEKLNIIDEISLEENHSSDLYSMVIYFVKSGDTLWKIAKSFRTTMEDIVSVNEIEDINKVYPGTQLYIPKFVKKTVVK